MEENDIQFHVREGVYPPAEDTFLLLDSIYSEIQGKVLEMGSGSGYLSVHLANRADMLIACDISLLAVKNTKENLVRNRIENSTDVLQTDLFLALADKRVFDFVIFNPPYLPADGNVTKEDRTYIGGIRGTEITEKFLKQAIKHLKPKGTIFVVVSSLADVESVWDSMRLLNLSADIINQKRLFFETLSILRGTPK
ncbi:methyltransferase domain-containing protein [Candidatus Thorarchaeota archaeon]|nr:MAG: methyltransferase domain-containing protein [Candidatus Thorarchaeota archaeon]